MIAKITPLTRDPVVRAAFERADAEGTSPPIVTNYFGGCPKCGLSDGYMNVRSQHWDVCDAHRVKWRIGSNLFSCWKEETEAQWRANAELLADYVEVQPLPCTDLDAPA